MRPAGCSGLTSDILPAKLPVLEGLTLVGTGFSTLFPATCLGPGTEQVPSQ